MQLTYTLNEIGKAADLLEKVIADGHKQLSFHGEMGAGKTTLISALCKKLGVNDAVSSPTFSIINEYASEQYGPIYHLDLYRLQSEREAIDAGVEDVLLSGNICLVEWPDIAPDLTRDAKSCTIEILSENKRKLTINL